MEKQYNQTPDDVIYGRNPVLEALRAGGRVEQIYLVEKQNGLSSLIRIAKENGIVIKQANRSKLDSLCGTSAHQGVAALLSSASYVPLEQLLAKGASNRGLVVLCDEVEDPHNLGAIIRTAEACGADGVILPKRRSAPIAGTCHKASAGACSHLPIAKVANLAAAIEQLKKSGYWIYAAEADGQAYTSADFAGSSIALVIGSEGRGVGKLIRERCDGCVSIPMYGKINSLNASVASGVLLYEVLRQRMGNAVL